MVVLQFLNQVLRIGFNLMAHSVLDGIRGWHTLEPILEPLMIARLTLPTGRILDSSSLVASEYERV